MSNPADLSPFDLIAPATVFATAPNPVVQVAWGVTNQGLAAASGGWYDVVWFSTNGMFDADSLNIGPFWRNEAVPAGGDYWQTNPVALPMAAGGNFALFVEVDANNSLYEASLADKVSDGVSGTVVFGFAPGITADPASLTISPGDSASFTVGVAGTMPLSYQWRFDGVDLAAATGPTLNIGDVQLASAGDYVVVVTNLFGGATSAVATLTVNPATNPPPLITMNIPMIFGPELIVGFNLSQGSSSSFLLLESGNLTGPWATNTIAVLATNTISGGYRFTLPRPAASEFYRILAP
jgi:hypothetical protein